MYFFPYTSYWPSIHEKKTGEEEVQSLKIYKNQVDIENGTKSNWKLLAREWEWCEWEKRNERADEHKKGNDKEHSERKQSDQCPLAKVKKQF